MFLKLSIQWLPPITLKIFHLLQPEKINFKVQRKFILSFISPLLSSFFDIYSVVRNDQYFGRVLKQYVQTICPQFTPSSGEILLKEARKGFLLLQWLLNDGRLQRRIFNGVGKLYVSLQLYCWATL